VNSAKNRYGQLDSDHKKNCGVLHRVDSDGSCFLVLPVFLRKDIGELQGAR
jgi:hypothetical protein